MITEIALPTEEALNRAAAVIKGGGLVAFPTETVYGLGADGLNGDAARLIFRVKGRPADNPLILHIDSPARLERCAVSVPGDVVRLAERFWPGPLTVVLKKRPDIPDEVTAGLDTVAVRCPDCAAARSLIRAADRPIAAPSANISGRTSPTSAEHVFADLNGKIGLILDGGPCGVGIESTILDMSSGEPVILRPGSVTPAMIESALGAKPGLHAPGGDRPKAPGMKYAHYAPKAAVTVVRGATEDAARYINGAGGEGLTGVICADENKGLYNTGIVIAVGSASDPAEIARNIYGALRRMDVLGAARVYCEAFPGTELGESVMDRLIRAAGHNIIDL